MNQNISSLTRKTKTEILVEYEKLLATLEDAKHASREVHEPTNIQRIVSARNDFTVSGVEEAVNELKNTTNEKLSVVSKKVTEALDALMQQTLKGIEKFSGLNSAIDLAEKQLKSQYNIEVAASTLEMLIAEYTEKKRQFELENATQHSELAESIASKRRDWQREEEEYAYTLKTTRTREQAQYEENRKKKETDIQLREDVLKKSEDELTTLRLRVENIPSECAKLVTTNEQEITRRLTAEHKAYVELLESTWESEKRILELTRTHLEAQYKKLEIEVVSAKKEIESAQRRAQELAVTVIEHGGGRLLTRSDAREGEEKKQ